MLSGTGGKFQYSRHKADTVRKRFRTFTSLALLASLGPWTAAAAFDERWIVEPTGAVDFGAQVATSEGIVVVSDPYASIDGVEDAGSVTVHWVDSTAGVARTQKLVLDAPQPQDQFGYSLALEGTRLIASSFRRMRVYVFDLVGDVWTLTGVLVPQGVFFTKVALSGDRIVLRHVLAPTASVYDRQPGGGWTLSAELTASRPGWTYALQDAVAVEGDTAVLGVTSRFLILSGFAAVFERSPNGWIETAILEPDDLGQFDAFGTAIDIEVDRILVGAPIDFGDFIEQGSAFLFERTDSGWERVQRFEGSETRTSSAFGTSVGMDGGRILIGATGDVVHDVTSGAAYVFGLGPSGWVEADRLVPAPPHTLQGADFGWSVALTGPLASVGMPFWSDMGPSAAYIYSLSPQEAVRAQGLGNERWDAQPRRKVESCGEAN